MRLTHEGYGKDAYNEYKFEVWKQGHMYSLDIERNGVELETIICPDMKVVRKNISRYLHEYTLNKVTSDY